MNFPSGEYCAPVTLPASLCATMSVFPLSTSTMRSLWSLPLHIRVLESPAHTTPLLSQSASLIFFTVLPGSSERYSSSRPLRSLTNAIHFPFGDQRGSCSFHEVSLTRCGSPRSVATVKISPCATTAARLLEGERWKPCASLRVTSSFSFSFGSALISITISLLFPVAVSSFQRPKFSSYTMVLPSAEMLGKNRLPSPWLVTRVSLPPLSEIFQMLLTLFITSGP